MRLVGLSLVLVRSGSAGVVLYGKLCWDEFWQARWVQLGNVPVGLRYGRLG